MAVAPRTSRTIKIIAYSTTANATEVNLAKTCTINIEDRRWPLLVTKSCRVSWRHSTVDIERERYHDWTRVWH